MAAAPLPLADPEYSPVSPELALVDSDLAAELRLGLAAPEDTRPVPAFEPFVVEVVEPEATLVDSPSVVAPQGEEAEDLGSIADLIVGYGAVDVVPPREEPEDVEYVVAAIERDLEETEAGTTSYPALPASVTGGMDTMDVAEPEARLADFGVVAEQGEEAEDLGSIADLIVGYEAVDVVPPHEEPEDVAYGVDAVQDDAEESEAGATSYPALPASVPGGVDPMDVVLREIRDRLTGRVVPSRRRRVRRRFTVASALGAGAAIAVLLADLYFDVVQVSGALPL